MDNDGPALRADIQQFVSQTTNDLGPAFGDVGP
jgi:hypothetical protein